MDFNFISWRSGRSLAPDDRATRSPPSASPSTSDSPACVNFGQAGFMAVGGYAFAITSVKFGWPLWASILAAIVAADRSSRFILGIPTLRLRADYLAIVTIAAAEIVRYTVKTPEPHARHRRHGRHQRLVARAFNAINPIPEGRYGFGILTYNQDDLWVHHRGLACLVAHRRLFVWQLMRSPWGRIVKGIREDEDAVRALGKNVYWYKMQALILGGVLGGARA